MSSEMERDFGGWDGFGNLCRAKVDCVRRYRRWCGGCERGSSCRNNRRLGYRYMRTLISKPYLKVLGRRALLGVAFLVIAKLAVA